MLNGKKKNVNHNFDGDVTPNKRFIVFFNKNRLGSYPYEVTQ